MYMDDHGTKVSTPWSGPRLIDSTTGETYHPNALVS